MQRTAFISSLVGAVGATQLTHVVPAAAAVDEASIGHEVFAQFRQDGELLFDSAYYEHLNEIGSVIADTVRSRYPYPIRYYVVRGDSANAFSVPGGNIYINEPLLRLAKNKDELAGVLAHETGHMVLHHVAKQIARSSKMGTLASIGSILGQVLLGPIASIGTDYALQNIYAGTDANLARHIEAQADEEGARIIAATNAFNPYGLIWFFEVMTATYGPGSNNWLIDHPIDANRIADLQRLFRENPSTFAKYTDTKSKDVAYW